jgi:hypothetical protein
LKNRVLKNAYVPAVHAFAAKEVVNARRRARRDEKNSA